MRVILENPETGEIKELGGSGNFRAPWRIKETISETIPEFSKYELEAKLAVLATKLGLPLANFLDAARWLLKKNCPFCQLGTQILHRLEELGEERTIALINRVLVAKSQNDMAALEQIKREMNG